MHNFKERIFKGLSNEKFNNIWVFFFIFLVKNIKINILLVLLIFLAGGFYIHHHSFISGGLLGIIGSAIASFNLVDGYKEYKSRNAKTIILSYLKSETDGLLETMLGYTKNIFENAAHTIEDKEQQKQAYAIWNKESKLWVKYKNHSKKELIKEIKELSILIFDYCTEYDSPQDIIDFSVAIAKMKSIKNIVSSLLIMVNDECLLSAYTELILILSSLDSTDLPDNVPIGGSDIDMITNCFYLLKNCYEHLLAYQEEINEYVKDRNVTHKTFYSEDL